MAAETACEGIPQGSVSRWVLSAGVAHFSLHLRRRQTSARGSRHFPWGPVCFPRSSTSHLRRPSKGRFGISPTWQNTGMQFKQKRGNDGHVALTTSIAINVFECEAQSVFQFTLSFLDFNKLRGNLSLRKEKRPEPLHLSYASACAKWTGSPESTRCPSRLTFHCHERRLHKPDLPPALAHACALPLNVVAHAADSN
jgi:hypothetical protein